MCLSFSPAWLHSMLRCTQDQALLRVRIVSGWSVHSTSTLGDFKTGPVYPRRAVAFSHVGVTTVDKLRQHRSEVFLKLAFGHRHRDTGQGIASLSAGHRFRNHGSPRTLSKQSGALLIDLARPGLKEKINNLSALLPGMIEDNLP